MSISVRRLISSALLVILFVGFVRSLPVKAEPAEWTFTVNSLQDLNDDILNSVCSVGAVDGGPCTLRAAIAEANAICDTFDITIYIPEGFYRLQIPPDTDNDIRSGDLNFPTANPDLKIKLIGTGSKPSIIDANQLDRVLDISAGVNIEIHNIHIRSGMLNWTGTNDQLDGAGILNEGNLILNKVILEENIASCGQATCNFVIGGGAIQNLGWVYMQDSTVFNNVAVIGSAIFNTGKSGYFFMKNSTVYGNFASNASAITNYAYLHIRNSTITGNTTLSGFLTGLVNFGTLRVESSTIANMGPDSSIVNADAGLVTIHDSILKNITSAADGNCANYGDPSRWTSTGYNIYNDDTCPMGPGDLANTDPLLGSLGNYGGLTKTMPLLPGSPALNHRFGNCMTIPESPVLPSEPLNEDQRHMGRSDGKCNTGAFEWPAIFMPLIIK